MCNSVSALHICASSKNYFVLNKEHFITYRHQVSTQFAFWIVLLRLRRESEAVRNLKNCLDFAASLVNKTIVERGNMRDTFSGASDIS